MATTSIWRVKGWLGKVVIYVENPDKTTNPKFYTEEDMTERDGRELSDVIRYAVNSDAQLYKQAGNGVTIPVVYAVGKRIVEIQNELDKEGI